MTSKLQSLPVSHVLRVICVSLQTALLVWAQPKRPVKVKAFNIYTMRNVYRLYSNMTCYSGELFLFYSFSTNVGIRSRSVQNSTAVNRMSQKLQHNTHQTWLPCTGNSCSAVDCVSLRFLSHSRQLCSHTSLVAVDYGNENSHTPCFAS